MLSHEPLRVLFVCPLKLNVDLFGQAVMNRLGGQKNYPRMMMLLVIPIEEAAAKRPGVLDTAEYRYRSLTP